MTPVLPAGDAPLLVLAMELYTFKLVITMNQKKVSSLWKFYQTHSHSLHFRITRLEFDNRKILQTNSHNIHSNISGLVTGFQEGETVLQPDTLLLYNL